MSELVITIGVPLLAAFIAALAAILAAVYTELQRDRKTKEKERKQRQNIIVQRYLYQLQDALASLWFRLGNLACGGGKEYMKHKTGSDEYYISTTLYALGRVLAFERIFEFEAVYPQLDAAYPELGNFFREHYPKRKLLDFNIFLYERNFLAEAIIAHESDLYRTITYFEFRKLYKEEEFRKELESAMKVIDSPDNDWIRKQMRDLFEPAEQITKYTSIVSTIPNRPNRENLNDKELCDLYWAAKQRL